MLFIKITVLMIVVMIVITIAAMFNFLAISSFEISSYLSVAPAACAVKTRAIIPRILPIQQLPKRILIIENTSCPTFIDLDAGVVFCL